MAQIRTHGYSRMRGSIPLACRVMIGLVLVLGMLALMFGLDTGGVRGQAPAPDKGPPPPAQGTPPPAVPPPAAPVTGQLPTVPGSVPDVAPQPAASGGSPGQPVPTPVAGPGPQVPPGAGLAGPGSFGVQVVGSAPMAPGARFGFVIDPKTPIKELLPPAPPVRRIPGPLLTDDLAQVPEVELQAAPVKPDVNKVTQEIALGMAKIHHLNTRKTDGFLLAVRGQRADLDGLPFAMGDACRTRGKRSELFKSEVELIRQAQPQPTPVPQTAPSMGPMPQAAANAQNVSGAKAFWTRYQAACTARDEEQPLDRNCREIRTQARIAALMQILAPEPMEERLGLVRYLAGVAHADATKALARLALFSSEDEVRQAALDALKVRRERDYTAILERGLRYPLPAVARRAADAISKLERSDLIPQLVAVLEEPDPRAPVVEEKDGKKRPVVREVVRVNHHRNCLMCHSPSSDTVAPTTLTAGVPIPGQPLNPPSAGYGSSIPDVLVRLDVTYLRQDFSVMQPVADANPWPEMQRFDFLVRTRALEPDEADSYRAKLEPGEPGKLSPYHRAALAALRDLTGRDTEPTAAAWRRLLDLPRREVQESH